MLNLFTKCIELTQDSLHFGLDLFSLPSLALVFLSVGLNFVEERIHQKMELTFLHENKFIFVFFHLPFHLGDTGILMGEIFIVFFPISFFPPFSLL